MRHNYRKMIAYDPVKKEVKDYRSLGQEYIFNGQKYDEVFYELWALSNHTTEVLLGISLSGDLYQLSPASYGRYVKEDFYSAQTINKGSVLRAVSEYIMRNNLPFGDEEDYE